MNINAKQFRDYVKFISIILIFDYPIMPFVLSIIEGKETCEYSILVCLLLSLFLLVIILALWLTLAQTHYIIFYTDRYRMKNLVRNDSRAIFLIKIFFSSKHFLNSLLGKGIVGGTTLIFSFGALYIFFYLFYNLIKLLMF